MGAGIWINLYKKKEVVKEVIKQKKEVKGIVESVLEEYASYQKRYCIVKEK